MISPRRPPSPTPTNVGALRVFPHFPRPRRPQIKANSRCTSGIRCAGGDASWQLSLVFRPGAAAAPTSSRWRGRRPRACSARPGGDADARGSSSRTASSRADERARPARGATTTTARRPDRPVAPAVASPARARCATCPNVHAPANNHAPTNHPAARRTRPASRGAERAPAPPSPAGAPGDWRRRRHAGRAAPPRPAQVLCTIARMIEHIVY